MSAEPTPLSLRLRDLVGLDDVVERLEQTVVQTQTNPAPVRTRSVLVEGIEAPSPNGSQVADQVDTDPYPVLHVDVQRYVGGWPIEWSRGVVGPAGDLLPGDRRWIPRWRANGGDREFTRAVRGL